MLSYTSDISWFGDLAVEAGDCIGYSDDGTVTKIIAMETIWKPHGLGTIRAYGVNSESGKTKPSDSSPGDAAYIKNNIVTPQVEELEDYVSDDLLGGNTISPKITKTQYNAMPSHDPKKLYIVRDENAGKTELYLGDEHISTGGGGGGGTINYAAVLSSEQQTYWAPEHNLVPVDFRGQAQVWYGQTPARFVCQGARMLYGVPRADVVEDDIMSELTLKYWDDTLQRVRIFIYQMYEANFGSGISTVIRLGALAFNVDAFGVETPIGWAVVRDQWAVLPADYKYQKLTIGFVHNMDSWSSYNGTPGPLGTVYIACMADGVMYGYEMIPNINGCFMNSSTAAYRVRRFSNDAELHFAQALTITTEPTTGE